jgi:hypothetical protein
MENEPRFWLGTAAGRKLTTIVMGMIAFVIGGSRIFTGLKHFV